MNTKIFFNLFIYLFLLSTNSCTNNPPDIPPNRVIPTEQQIEYHEMEVIGFVHFTMNTFTDKEWGYGDESTSLFNPTELNRTDRNRG